MLHSPPDATLARGFAAGLAARTERWRPGLPATCRHGEIFAPAAEASGVGLALALARDSFAPAQLQSGGLALDQLSGARDDASNGQRPWLWVQDKAARRLGGRPYRAGLPRGLRHRLIHVAANSAQDALFALEEGLRCRDLAFVIGEIAGNPRALGLTASRRLSLAAEQHGVPLWLVRLDAAHDLGSARLRWEARSAPSLPPRWNPAAPGAPAWQADLFRAHTYQPGSWVLREAGGLGGGLMADGVQPERDFDSNPIIRSA